MRLKDDPDELRKWVLKKNVSQDFKDTVRQKSKNIVTLATKVRKIIANRYQGITDFTISEQQLLLHNWPSIKTKLEDLPYTSEVFFEKFTDFVSPKNNATASQAEQLSLTENQRVSTNELPTLPPPEGASSSYEILRETEYLTSIRMNTPEIFRQGPNEEGYFVPEKPD